MKNKIIIFGLLFTLTFSGCQKTYNCGPLISFVTPLTRINGDYSVESVTENGIDQMNKIEALKIEAIHFVYIGVYKSYGYDYSVSYTDTSAISISVWSIINSQSQLSVLPLSIQSSYPNEIPFAPLPGFMWDSTGNVDFLHWDILKLTDKKLWIKTTFHNQEYEVHLKQ